jgi:transcriptional regulator with XRE-family HTH domain
MSTLKIYKSYNFVDKDPVIDRLRGIVGGYKYREVSDMSGVSETTIYNWFNGKTRRPQYATVMAVIRAMGYRQEFIKRRKGDTEDNVVPLPRKRRAVS